MRRGGRKALVDVAAALSSSRDAADHEMEQDVVPATTVSAVEYRPSSFPGAPPPAPPLALASASTAPDTSDRYQQYSSPHLRASSPRLLSASARSLLTPAPSCCCRCPGRERTTLTALLAYDSDDERTEPRPPQAASGNALSVAAAPLAAAPAASLDSRVQSFLSQLSPLVARVEQQLGHEERSIASPSTVWHEAVDPLTGRQFYHSRSGRLVTWQQPPVFLPPLQSAAPSSLSSSVPVSPPDSPPPLESVKSPPPAAVSPVEAAVLSLRDRLQRLRPDRESAAAADRSPMLQWELCQCELSIRWQDWKAGAVQEEYVMHRLQLLADSLHGRFTAQKDAAAARPTAALPAATTDAVATIEAAAAPATPPQHVSSAVLVSASAPAAVSPAATSTGSSLTAAAPPRRTSCTISKPPSQPIALSSDTASAPASQPPDAVKRGREDGSGDLRRVKARKQQRVGAVHAMMGRWKAVREEAEREEQHAEAARGREEEERIAQCEQEVRRTAAEAGRDNANLAPLGDWRARVRAARERQRSADAD